MRTTGDVFANASQASPGNPRRPLAAQDDQVALLCFSDFAQHLGRHESSPAKRAARKALSEPSVANRIFFIFLHPRTIFCWRIQAEK